MKRCAADDPLDRQFKIRCTTHDLETIERLAHDGVTLPARTIKADGNKSELVRQALGLSDPPETTPGKNALEELTRRVRG
jgi:hypothetical protein